MAVTKDSIHPDSRRRHRVPHQQRYAAIVQDYKRCQRRGAAAADGVTPGMRRRHGEGQQQRGKKAAGQKQRDSQHCLCHASQPTVGLSRTRTSRAMTAAACRRPRSCVLGRAPAASESGCIGLRCAVSSAYVTMHTEVAPHLIRAPSGRSDVTQRPASASLAGNAPADSIQETHCLHEQCGFTPAWHSTRV